MRIFGVTAILAFLIDQISKALILYVVALPQIGNLPVLPPFLQFHMAWNRGVNFGLLSRNGMDMRWILTGLAVVVSLSIAVWAIRSVSTRLGLISAGLLVGGALANAIDRVIYGAVVDFLNMSCCGINNPYAFNIADVFIFAGAIGLAIFPADKKDG